MFVDNRRIMKFLWYFSLPLWLASLTLSFFLLLQGSGSPVVNILGLAGSAVLGFVTAFSLFQSTPRIKSLEERSKQLRNFCGAIRKAARTLELQEILDSASQIIVDVTGVRGCTIEILDQKKQRMEVRSVVGLDSESKERAINLAENIYQGDLMHGDSVVVRDIFLRKFPSVNEEVESLICVPLRLEERVLGAVCIYGKIGQKLSQEMMSLLSDLGNVISLAVAHAFVHEDLKNLVQTKTQFMLQTSHELRSPLNSIQSMARTLMEGYLGDLNEKQREMISRIDLRAHALSDIVNDLLFLAKGRAEISMLKLVKVDLHKICHECIKLFESRAREKDIELILNDELKDAQINGNEEGLFSIITNLLSNAIKYTPEKGQVSLKLEEDHNRIIFEVKDTGIGIPESDKDKIFSEFYRASNAKAASETGTGLGLSIVKSTVEQHGGTLHIESCKGQGTLFRIFFNKPLV